MGHIDLDLDLEHHQLYWTDRGDNTVSRAPLDPPAGFDPAARNNRMFYTSLAGVLATAALDGSGAQNVLTGQGTLTGLAFVTP